MDTGITDGQLWGYSIATYGLGDIATTTIGLSQSGIHEANPLAQTILGEWGALGMIGAKVGTLAGAYALYRVTNEEWRVGVPIGLSMIGTAIMLNNTAVIGTALMQ